MPNIEGLEGLLAGGVLVAAAGCVLLYTQCFVPRRQRRQVTEALLAAGWVPLDPSSDEAVAVVERLALERPLGADWQASYALRVGPVTSQVRVRQSARGSSERVFRDPSSMRRRYAGIASTRRTTHTTSSLAVGAQTRIAVGRSLWIGEARRLPVDKVELVACALGELLGAAPRGLAPGSRGASPPASASPLADRLRPLLQARDAGRRFAGSLWLSPQAWVLLVPLGHLGSQQSAVLETAREISAALD